MNDIELVVFDLAGTTIEDNGEVPEAFTAALQAHGLKRYERSLASRSRRLNQALY